jgi:hypothetical protein
MPFAQDVAAETCHPIIMDFPKGVPCYAVVRAAPGARLILYIGHRLILPNSLTGWLWNKHIKGACIMRINAACIMRMDIMAHNCDLYDSGKVEVGSWPLWKGLRVQPAPQLFR